MAEITLKFDARNKIAKKTLDYIMSLGVFKTNEQSIYNPKFVAMVKKAKNSKKRTIVDTTDIWGSLGLK